MDCQDVATLPTPGLLSAHAAIGIGVCGNSCYAGLLIWFSMAMGYAIVDQHCWGEMEFGGIIVMREMVLSEDVVSIRQ